MQHCCLWLGPGGCEVSGARYCLNKCLFVLFTKSMGVYIQPLCCEIDICSVHIHIKLFYGNGLKIQVAIWTHGYEQWSCGSQSPRTAVRSMTLTELTMLSDALVAVPMVPPLSVGYGGICPPMMSNAYLCCTYISQCSCWLVYALLCM